MAQSQSGRHLHHPANLTYAMLRYVPRVSFADFDTAKKFETWIKPPGPTVAMFVEGELV
jgi:hypothetical protein